jgi:hypothetical protein
MGMSPLEITNRIRDAERRGASYRGLMSTQTALENWTAKYPLDPWIAPREYRLSRLFASLRSHDGNAQAARCRAIAATSGAKVNATGLAALLLRSG